MEDGEWNDSRKMNTQIKQNNQKNIMCSSNGTLFQSNSNNGHSLRQKQCEYLDYWCNYSTFHIKHISHHTSDKPIIKSHYVHRSVRHSQECHEHTARDAPVVGLKT